MAFEFGWIGKVGGFPKVKQDIEEFGREGGVSGKLRQPEPADVVKESPSAKQVKDVLSEPWESGPKTKTGLDQPQPKLAAAYPDRQTVPPALDDIYRSRGASRGFFGAFKNVLMKVNATGDPIKPSDQVDAPSFLTRLLQANGAVAQIMEMNEMRRAAKGLDKKPPMQGQAANDLPEVDERRQIESQYQEHLGRVMNSGKLKSAGSVILFFLTSMLIGVKNASMIFSLKADNGTLDPELRMWEKRYESALQEERYAKRMQQQSRVEAIKESGRDRRFEDLEAGKFVRQQIEIEDRLQQRMAKAQTDAEKAKVKEDMDSYRVLNSAIWQAEAGVKRLSSSSVVDQSALSAANKKLADLKALRDARFFKKEWFQAEEKK